MMMVQAEPTNSCPNVDDALKRIASVNIRVESLVVVGLILTHALSIMEDRQINLRSANCLSNNPVLPHQLSTEAEIWALFLT